MGVRGAAWGGLCLIVAMAACGGPREPFEGENSALFRQVPGSCDEEPLPVAAARASAEETNHFHASLAIDGDPATRWSSGPATSAWLILDMGKRVMVRTLLINWERAFSPSFWVQASDNAVNWGTLEITGATQAGEQSIIGLDATTRYLRILSQRPSSFGNVSITEVTVLGDADVACLGVPATCTGPALLAAASAKASSTEFSYTPASAAVDGVFSTRWSSQFTDDQWLAVDLGGVARIDWVNITWEHAFAKSYALQTGTTFDGPWTTVVTINDGQFGTASPNVGATARYLRLLGLKRATQYGYSVWELEVFGSRATSCP